MVTHFDVVIVGASIAGSTAAILLGRAGLRVALVERHGKLDAFKALCTHHVMGCATPTIHRLGVDTTIEAAGGIRNGLNLYTPWGWVVTPPDTPHGYSIRREILDPMLRRTAAETAGVDLRLGQKAVALLAEQAGVRVRDAHGTEHDILAPLVVGADGVHSSVAALAGGTTRVVPNNRFMYFAEFTGVRLHGTARTELWMHESAISYAIPNDGGVTVLATMPTKAELPSFRSNPEAALLAALRKLPDAPRFDPGGRVSKIIGAPDCPLITRTAMPTSTVALIGDAALTSDPSQGVGCGWAFQSAEWLADEVAPALLDGRPVAAALRRYQRRRTALRGHQTIIEQEAKAEPPTAIDRLIVQAAVRDTKTAAHLLSYINRRITPIRFLAHPALVRAAYVNARSSTSNLRQRSAVPIRTD